MSQPLGLQKLLVATAIIALSMAASASGSKEFGKGQPKSLSDLPPGQLKQTMTGMPQKARGQALGWLQRFSFPEADVTSLRVDAEGGVYYEEPPLAEAVISTDGNAPPSTALQATLDNALQLHSKPGATHELYIDFSGGNIEGRAWNQSYGVSEWQTKVFDTDGDPTTFSDAERAVIAEVWHRVADDYAPFDIDVTTELPSEDKVWGHALVTFRRDLNNVLLPGSSEGTPAIAYVGVFSLDENDPQPYDYYKPAFVYADNYGFSAQLIAEAVSHEFGHNLSLSHDGSLNSSGQLVDAYYLGHGTGDTGWAPIMGAGYYSNVTHFTDASYVVKANNDVNSPQYCPDCAAPNNSQDDLAEIEVHLGYSADEHADTIAGATLLEVGPTGEVVVSNPEWDPYDVYPGNKGVIHSASDADVFKFEAAAGPASFQVNPAWDAWYRDLLRGSNLDVVLELLDENGTVLASSDPQDQTEATVSATLSAGSHYLAVSGTGSSVGEYSDYDSLGYYYIFGSITTANTDLTPPSPSPMAWSTEPSVVGVDAITMTAVTATDGGSSVQYNFVCVSGGAGCRDSGWQSGTTWTLTSLARDATYTFQVKARDEAGNETDLSVAKSATTPPFPPAQPSGTVVTALSNDDVQVDWVDNSDNEDSFRIERQAQGESAWTVAGSVAANVVTFRDIGVAAETAYTYRVFAENAGGLSINSTPATDTTKPVCAASKEFAAGIWHQFSLPCNTFPNNTVVEVFDGLDSGDYVSRWSVWKWDETASQYSRLSASDEVEEGRGYWFKTLDTTTLAINGHPNSHADYALLGDAAGRWNMIGMYRNLPGNTWASVQYIDGVRVKSIDEMDPFGNGQNSGVRECDYNPGGNKCKVQAAAGQWNGNAYNMLDGSTNDGSMDPFSAVFVRVFADGVKIRWPVPSGGGNMPISEAGAVSGGDQNKPGKGKGNGGGGGTGGGSGGDGGPNDKE
ncbi:MAG: hypothetical protein ACO3KY_13085 [Lysobacterales bacterium]